MYKLSKTKDTKFQGKHPNFILEGMKWYSKADKHPKPVIGERFHFGTAIDHPREHLFTSLVTKIKKLKNKSCIFYTENSIYKLEKVKNYGK